MPTDSEDEVSTHLEVTADLAYGQTETDYRPTRWQSFREADRYTGKHDDYDVGLVYFGARYFVPGLNRWASADPLAIHGLGGDLNPYSFVLGSPFSLVDPLGLVGEPAGIDPDTTEQVGPTTYIADCPNCTNGNDYEIWDSQTPPTFSSSASAPSVDPRMAFADAVFALGDAYENAGNGTLSRPSDDPPNNREFTGFAPQGPQDTKVYNPTPGQRFDDNIRAFTLVGSAAASVLAVSAASASAGAVVEDVGLTGVQANRVAGNAFRDEIAAALRGAGRDAQTEVYKATPFGKRFIDIEVSQDGKILGGVETKLGSSPYTPAQRAKDTWLLWMQRYPVNVVRGP